MEISEQGRGYFGEPACLELGLDVGSGTDEIIRVAKFLSGFELSNIGNFVLPFGIRKFFSFQNILVDDRCIRGNFVTPSSGRNH